MPAERVFNTAAKFAIVGPDAMPVMVSDVEHGRPGDEITLASAAADGRAAVVFEDDGETGYFYVRATADGPILDALHVYNVEDVVDRDRLSEYKVGWSASGRQAVLLINSSAHAVYDFDRGKGWCRNGFPPGHEWDDACLEHFR